MLFEKPPGDRNWRMLSLTWAGFKPIVTFITNLTKKVASQK